MDSTEEYRITVRDGPKLDGARSKKQVWRPDVRTWGLSEANVLHWSSCDIVRTFRRPHSNPAPGELCPFVTSLITARSDAPQQIMVHSSNQRHTGTLGFSRGKIFNSPVFLRHFEEKRIGEFSRAMVLFQKVSQNKREVFQSCPNLPPLRTPIALTQTLWQNTSYLQLSGFNHWFYVVIIIFDQHLNICSPKLVEWRRLLPPPGDTSGNSCWWLCGFEPFVASANP